jgi:hypothetical protein
MHGAFRLSALSRQVSDSLFKRFTRCAYQNLIAAGTITKMFRGGCDQTNCEICGTELGVSESFGHRVKAFLPKILFLIPATSQLRCHALGGLSNY